ncbi:Asparagine--tRNA ligase [Sebaldella termitidis]|jgi:asparaginyl-tRNA synthetase|uniref:Asparagine--tRNA ligase n=1 Tax=Sebaldella termitidis (strain ATCC 33386 / NCTC 11300) TaxID=526218 RepID=D1ALJ3_SEBTE|nr:asparagine--tRNA ligase [Sebaldella termitidis]ACZ09336.1 asparaginyl-tRNA synthetase [Sebaldella termitidis ATCC 33386]SUI24656.1 Asparagine--tRNA ligase [Sebaldella termitidis]
MLLEIREIYKKHAELLNKELELNGWIRKRRDQKNFGFLEVNDGTFFNGIQVVFDDSLSNFDEISRLSISSSVHVKGVLVQSEGKGQTFEIKAKEITIYNKADLDYPLQNKRHTLEYLRTIAHLRPRTNTFMAVFRVRSLMSYAIHKFFNERGFVYVHTPIITGSDTEGAGEMFQLTTLDLKDIPKNDKGEVEYKDDFFGKQANLTVSGQLNVETFCMAFKNTYTFGPTFRAEKSNTPKHVSEFWMMEPEIAFADLDVNMDIAEDMMKYIIRYVLENAPEEMQFFNQFIDKTLLDRLNGLVNSEFGRVTYTEAIEILKKADKKFEYPVEWGIDLQTEHERYLAEEHFKKPVFVTDYPKDIKAFYMKLNEDGKTVRAMDLLAPGIGEIIGGSQREDNFEKLEQRIKDMNLNEKDYWWYMELRKYGSVPHSGYGLGFERAIMYVTGMLNIRDVIPFPRGPKSLEF